MKWSTSVALTGGNTRERANLTELIPCLMPAQSPSTHFYPRDLTQFLLSTEGILITDWKPKGADVMLERLIHMGGLAHWLVQFGRRCREGFSVRSSYRSMKWPSVISPCRDGWKWENWYFYDKLNGVELHQADNKCFTLSCSPMISKLILQPAIFAWKTWAVSC